MSLTVTKRNRKWLTVDAGAAEFPNVIEARGVINARRRLAFVDVDFTSFTGEADQTVTAE